MKSDGEQLVEKSQNSRCQKCYSIKEQENANCSLCACLSLIHPEG